MTTPSYRITVTLSFIEFLEISLSKGFRLSVEAQHNAMQCYIDGEKKAYQMVTHNLTPICFLFTLYILTYVNYLALFIYVSYLAADRLFVRMYFEVHIT